MLGNNLGGLTIHRDGGHFAVIVRNAGGNPLITDNANLRDQCRRRQIIDRLE